MNPKDGTPHFSLKTLILACIFHHLLHLTRSLKCLPGQTTIRLGTNNSSTYAGETLRPLTLKRIKRLKGSWTPGSQPPHLLCNARVPKSKPKIISLDAITILLGWHLEYRPTGIQRSLLPSSRSKSNPRLLVGSVWESEQLEPLSNPTLVCATMGEYLS